MMRHQFVLLILQFVIPCLTQTEHVDNFYMETVMKIRESRNKTCAEIKDDTIQMVGAFYYAMSMISRAQTFPKVRYFTVTVDFCEIINNYQTGFSVSKNFYKQSGSHSENETIEYNIFPELQAFLSLDGNQTVFETELEDEEAKIENATTPFDNTTVTAGNTTFIVENTTSAVNLTNETTSSTTTLSSTASTMPSTQVTEGKNIFIREKERVMQYWDKWVNDFEVSSTKKKRSRLRARRVNITTTTVTTPETTTVELETTTVLVPEEPELEWLQENSVCFNISRERLKAADPQLTALIEVEDTFSIFKDILMDDYTQNNVPVISNAFEFLPHEKELQIVLADLFECHQWNILSVIYSQNLAEKKEYINFLKYFPDICVSEQIGIAEDTSDSDYDHLVWLLHTNIRNTNVILCFCDRKEIEKLMQAVSRYDVVMPFTFIFVHDGLMNNLNFSTGYEEYLVNSYIVGRDIDYLEEFGKAFITDYFSTRNFNPWMVDYKRQNVGAANITANETDNNETVQEFVNNFVVNPEVKGIILGVFAADAALRTYLKPNKGSKYYNGNFTFMDIWKDIIRGTVTYEQDLNPNFLSINKLKVAKFEKFENGNVTTYEYIVIKDTLINCLNGRQIPIHYLPLGLPPDRSTIFKYECLESCPHGYEKIMKNVHCLIYDPEDEDWQKVRNCTECVKFPEEDVYGHLMIIPMLISVLGLFFTALVSQTFVMHHYTPVVKTSIYLSSIILGSMIAVHSIVILLSLKICLFTCGVFKYVIPLCFTIMYSAMLVKINRMYRAWECPPFGEAVNVPKLTSKKSAVILITILVAFESVMIFLHLTLGKEKIFHDEYISTGYEFNLDRLCPLHSDTTMINYFFNALIISVTFLYSRVVKSLMHNFYEAKYMYWTLCLTFWLWFAFFTLYFKSNLKVLVFSICVSVNSLIPLVLMFFPKMYVIWFNPDMNDLKSFYNMHDYQLDSKCSNVSETSLTPVEEKESREKRENKDG